MFKVIFIHKKYFYSIIIETNITKNKKKIKIIQLFIRYIW